MAISKLILNGETQMDVTSNTNVASNMLNGVIGTKNDGTKVTGNIASKSSDDLTASGATVTAPAGYYANAASKAVTTTTHPNPSASITSSTGVVTASHTQGTGYVTGGTTTGTLNLTTQAGKTVTPTESVQTAVASYRWTTGNVNVAAISSTYVGTGITTRSAADLTAIGSVVTAPAGYYSTAATKAVAAGSAFPPAVTITKAPTIGVNTSGVVTASYSGSSSITPTVTSGYVSKGTAGTISTTGTSTYQLTSKAAATYYPSTADQTVASQRWLVGNQTFKSVTTTNLTAANIKTGTIVKIGDSANASRITQITGTYTNDATASANDILSDKTAYVNGIKVTGTINQQAFPTALTNSASGDKIADLIPSGAKTLLRMESGYYSQKGYYQLPTMQNYPSPLTYSAGGSIVTTITPQRDYVRYLNFYSGYYASQSYYVIPSGYIIPNGTSTITANGTYDVADYANADVNVTGGEYYYLLKALAENAIIYSIGSSAKSYTSMDVSNYFNSLQTLEKSAFGGRLFSGTFTFANISTVPVDCFASAGLFHNLTVTSYNKYFTINLPEISRINTGAFAGNSYLSLCIAPKCTSIASYAFAYCGFSSISFPACTYIDYCAFFNCTYLTEATFASSMSAIDSSAFCSCSRLLNINISDCSTIGAYAFHMCNKLSTIISFPHCTSIGRYAFNGCWSISTINLPNCTTISDYTFAGCTHLTTVRLPLLSTCNSYAFTQCFALTNIELPSCTDIGKAAFDKCSALTTIKLPICTQFSLNAFCSCYNLISLYLNSVSTIPAFGTSMFYSTPISNYSASAGRYGSIFVPASLFNSFKTATNWAVYSARMVSV